ncbi:hypothetical protein [Bifidobacterium saguinibicoloris]|uniref:hypothetical protein n=1 Tax=Bifidobacterium saguinibicoloris TaxID=2834433 RepID=UPI001C58DEBA|nr:hypothetical protein [Bifidobacterium saguinibicoloris]MBW3080210.1 hypothetical protein [Bifidobacterium saguinibicoloris]
MTPVPEPPLRVATRIGLLLMSAPVRAWATLRRIAAWAFVCFAVEAVVYRCLTLADDVRAYGPDPDRLTRADAYGMLAGADLLRPWLAPARCGMPDAVPFTGALPGMLLLAMFVAQATWPPRGFRRGGGRPDRDAPMRRYAVRAARCLWHAAVTLVFSVGLQALGALAALESHDASVAAAAWCALAACVLYAGLELLRHLAYAVVERSFAFAAHLGLSAVVVCAVTSCGAVMLWRTDGVAGAWCAATAAILYVAASVDGTLELPEPVSPSPADRLAAWLGFGRRR